METVIGLAVVIGFGYLIYTKLKARNERKNGGSNDTPNNEQQ